MKIAKFLSATVIAAALVSCGGSDNQTDNNSSSPSSTSGSSESVGDVKNEIGGSEKAGKAPTLDLRLIEGVVADFKECKSSAAKPHMCKEFVSKAVSVYYSYDNLQAENGAYLDYDEILGFVRSSDDWESLGSAKDQSVLNKAQENANAGIATLAINTKGTNSIAIVVKGKLSHSNSMGLDCPSVAVLRPRKVNKSFVGKGINYAWSNLADVEVFSLKQ